MDIQRKLLITDMKRLLRVMSHKTRLRVLALFLLMLLLAVVEVASIFSMSLMTLCVAVPDRILQQPLTLHLFQVFPSLGEFCADPRYFALAASLLVVVLIIIKNALTALTTWRCALLGEDISRYTGTRIMEHFLKSDYMAHMSGDSTSMFQALSWRPQLGTLLMCVMCAYTYAFTAVALLITILSATPGAILSTLGIIGCIVLVVYRCLKTSVDRCADTASKAALAQNRTAMTAMRGIREVILYRQQKTFYKKYHDSCKASSGPNAFLRVAPPIPTWILETFGFISIPTTIFLLTYRGEDMVVITAVITMIMLIAWRILPILNKSLGCLVEIRSVRPQAMACLERLEKIKDLHLPDPPEPDPDFRFEHDIVLEQVCFRYPNATRDSLSDISLSIQHGEQVGLIGTSGSGKTTLAGILCGLLPFESGSMLVDDKVLDDRRKAAYIQRVGYVSQTPYIFNGTIAENVAFSQWGKPCDAERVKKVCRMAALDIVDTDPKGIEYLIGDNGAGLSGGQAQRVSIARALYANPQVLILDESTSALDLGTEQAIMETIQQLKGHLTIIIIAHRLSTVERCDRLFWIDRGRLHKVGTPKQILPEYTRSLISTELQEGTATPPQTR